MHVVAAIDKFRGTASAAQAARAVSRAVERLGGTCDACPVADGGEGTIRPDMVVRLAGGKNIIVDSKVSLAAYLDAAGAYEPEIWRQRLDAHARHLRRAVNAHALGHAARDAVGVRERERVAPRQHQALHADHRDAVRAGQHQPVEDWYGIWSGMTGGAVSANARNGPQRY